MQIGEKVRKRMETGEPQGSMQNGTVVYIHPTGRLYAVEFIVHGVAIRQSFRADE